jgi:glutamyl/glutaminyl-tRNA synthetase
VDKTRDMLKAVDTWDSNTIGDALKAVEREAKQPSKVVMQILRYALTGLQPGVKVAVVMEILGRDKVNARLEDCRSGNFS